MKSIKTLLAAAGMAVMTLNASAQDLPMPSPAANFTQRVGVSDISMIYSRPAVKGRTIWGDLVPYNEMWRAGANASTKIEFSTEVLINGINVKAGKYALFILPTAAEWTFVISTYTEGWGTTGYTEASDVVRISVKPQESGMVENLMFSIDNIKDDACEVNLSWEKMTAGFDVSIKTKDLAGKNVANLVKEADNSFRKYNDAAKWYLSTEENAKAVDMAEKSVAQSKKFWNLTVLSEAYMANDNKKMAIKTAKEALALSEKEEYKPYIKRNVENIEKWEATK